MQWGVPGGAMGVSQGSPRGAMGESRGSLAVLTPPSQLARGREGDLELLKAQLGGPGPPESLSDEELPLDPRLYQELCAGAFDEHGLVSPQKLPPPGPQNCPPGTPKLPPSGSPKLPPWHPKTASIGPQKLPPGTSKTAP